jgi:hypothetical protein
LARLDRNLAKLNTHIAYFTQYIRNILPGSTTNEDVLETASFPVEFVAGNEKTPDSSSPIEGTGTAGGGGVLETVGC